MEQATKLLPKWNESDIDTFLRSFERLAEAHGWPKETFLAIIKPHFYTKAQKVFLNLSADIAYNDAKEQLLLAYEIVPEWHRNKFRTQGKSDKETFSDHAYNLTNLFDRRKYENIDRLKEIILLERFYNTVSEELRAWLLDKKTINTERCG